MSWPVVQVSCVVEGHGEEEAVPVLIRRVAHDHEIIAKVPWLGRVSRSKLVKKDELQRVVNVAAKHVLGRGGVFVLIDADDACPAELGPRMQAWAAQARPDRGTLSAIRDSVLD